MTLPQSLTLREFAYVLDGGSIELLGSDEAGQTHVVRLVARGNPRRVDAGRLFFDEDLIPIRSAEEGAVLELLRHASVQCDDGDPREVSPNTVIFGDDIKQVMSRNDEENVRALAADVIGFVESDRYVELAKEVQMAHDPARYAVRAVLDETRRTAVIVGLSRALHLGVAKARKRLDEDRVIGTHVSAYKVTELAKRCAAEGVAIEVEPEFPWPLPDLA